MWFFLRSFKNSKKNRECTAELSCILTQVKGENNECRQPRLETFHPLRKKGAHPSDNCCFFLQQNFLLDCRKNMCSPENVKVRSPHPKEKIM